jgi:hypothetical protein
MTAERSSARVIGHLHYDATQGSARLRGPFETPSLAPLIFFACSMLPPASEERPRVPLEAISFALVALVTFDA